MENLKYKVFNPGGNKTALVMENNYNEKQIKLINDFILSNNSDIEQVGFISKNENRLDMAGGEFCVNATRCAIWEYLNGKKGEIKISVSGFKEYLIGGIIDKNNVYVNIPINKKICDIMKKKGKYTFIKLDGILFAIMNIEKSTQYIKGLKENEQQVKNMFLNIMKEFKTKEKACGIILLEKEGFLIKINPIIWVKEMDTLYYETACGSGSLATAIYINHINGAENLDVLQPSGYSINVKLKCKDKYIRNAILSGNIVRER